MPLRARHAVTNASELTSGETVKAEQLANLIDDFDRIGSMEAEDIVQPAIEAAIEDIATLARRYAPRDTGELANSIEARIGPKTGTVVATAPHAAFVEFGTWSHNLLEPKSGTYEIVPVRARALRFEVDGDVVFAQKVNHPGVEAQPFLNPAADEIVPEFVEMLENVGVNLIVEGPR